MTGFDPRRLFILICFAALASTAAANDRHTIVIAGTPPAVTDGFKMGEARRPDGATVRVDSRSLLLNGKRWTPAMGEFHYARYPENEWREELLKMKAGGIDVVSTYVFWIHHEEREGRFDWTGQRNLRRFVQLCGELDLKMIVRCGPWDHGEVRNGGFPDWVEKGPWKTRSDDTNYLAKVKIFYDQIAQQLSGQLWKDGGPVIGIQVENEYGGPAQHLLTLKRLAREAGLDVPLYTRTGWPAMSTPMPFGEIIPLYGVYAEGFWDRELTPMPGKVYWRGFQFSRLRTEEAFATDMPGEKRGKEAGELSNYPYLSCEIGAGMMSSYHRRILVNPLDCESTTLVKLGSGGALVGYYMYHGGGNPQGELSTLMESQATGMWNDMPVKNYDFQTALGEYGQIRPQYHMLRRIHLFLKQWGPHLADMDVNLPDQRPHDRHDVDTLRWSVRSDGQSGFVFVNNYQRLQDMPARPDTQFAIQLPNSSITFPQTPVTVPANDCFIWPFNLELSPGLTLAWATAQPITAVQDGTVSTVFFAATKGVPPQFAFSTNGTLRLFSGVISRETNGVIAKNIKPGRGVALKLGAPDGRVVQIVVLDEADSLGLWKANWQGQDRAFLTRAGLVIDGNELRLTSTDRNDLTVGIYPAPIASESAHHASATQSDIFQRIDPAAPSKLTYKVTIEKVQAAGPLREIPIGKIDKPVATAPLDADFQNAAVWRIKLPAHIELNSDPILRLSYVGDVARIMMNGKFVTDDFYNGNTFEVGLRRYGPEILKGDLQIAILPLRKDAPIYMAQEARPDFGNADSIATLRSAEIIPRYQLGIGAAKVKQTTMETNGETTQTK